MIVQKSNSRRIAVLSDVHANLPALLAVLADADAAGARELVVCGDVVGFGASPAAVVDALVARRARMIRGNWEADFIAPAVNDGVPPAWAADPNKAPLLWTVDQLGNQRCRALADLPDSLDMDGALFVHGTPRSVREGVLPSTAIEDVVAAFSGETARLCFVGHTHTAMDRVVGDRRVINPGSVGLPTDGDPRAAYAIVDLYPAGDIGSATVELRRVEYDREASKAAFDSGLRAAAPWFADLVSRQLDVARNLYPAWLKLSDKLDLEEYPSAMERFLRSS